MLKKNVSAEGYGILNNVLSCVKLHPDAEEPFKENQYDVAWDVTIIGRAENRVEDVYGDVNVFTTGIQISVPKNYHLEILEHPQLYKTGYTLQGGTRFVNPEDKGEILIPLFKFKESEDLELPFRAAVLVLRETQYIPITTVAKTAPRRATKQAEIYEEEEEEVAPPRRTTKGKGRGQTKSNHMF